MRKEHRREWVTLALAVAASLAVIAVFIATGRWILLAVCCVASVAMGAEAWRSGKPMWPGHERGPRD